MWGLEPEGSELYAELSSRGEPADQRALSQLRMELARREATIQRLEAKLLEAISAPEQESPAPTPPAPLRRVAEPASEETGTAEREELRALRREMATALGVAGATIFSISSISIPEYSSVHLQALLTSPKSSSVEECEEV